MDNGTNQLNDNQMQKAKKAINLRVSEDFAELLKAEAERTHRSVSSFIRAVLEMVLLDDEEVSK